MSGKTQKLVKQEGRESYGNEAEEGATEISQGSEEFVGADGEFEAACAEENSFNAARKEESAARSRSQRVGNLARHATGTAKKRDEDKAEGNTVGNCTQLEKNHVDQAKGDVKTFFGGGNGWVRQ